MNIDGSGQMRSSLEIYTLSTAQSRVVLQSDDLIEAPNWDPSGKGLLVNRDGRLFSVPFDEPRLMPVDTGDLVRCNNDHLFSRDGSTLYFGCHCGQGAEVFCMDATGGMARLVSPQPPTWLHGISPDCQTLLYVAARGDKTRIDVYTKPLDGPETRLTRGEGMCDGPDFSADGTQIYYNCDRTGHAQIWVMQADGSGQRQVFADDRVNWFPHPSPDGAHVLYLAYPPGTQGHPRDLPVSLCLMGPDGTDRRDVLRFVGGQGSINVPSWSPDGTEFAYFRYNPIP